MNYSSRFIHGLQADPDTMAPDHAIDGFAITHDATDQHYIGNFDSLTSSRNHHHQHNPSMASIDSVFNRPGPSSPNHLHDKDASQASGIDDLGPDYAPTWSELKTKAGKERKRLPLACIACRRKKIKCSGEKPACKHCLKARIPCVYKVTTRKAAPRTDYMAMLDKRLKRMEDRVIKIIPKDELPEPATRSVLRPPLPGNTPQPDKDDANTKRSADEAFTSELTTWSKARAGSIPLDTAARIRGPRDIENKLFTQGAEALPPQHIQEHLVEVYFDCVYGQSYLLLHKPSFIRKLKSGSVPPVLLLSICAISARFSTHPQLSTEPAFLRGEKWATPARKIVEERHFEPNITILTCMVMLALHYFGTCEGGLSWSFGGQASRMAYALQLHKELDHDPLGLAQAERAEASGKPVPHIPELSFTDREIRRRVMWSCYMMDTFNSSGTERPSFLNEEYVFIQLPIKESHFQMELPGRTEDLEGHVPLTSAQSSADNVQVEAKENMGVAAYVVRAVVIWKHVVKYLNLGGKEKDSYQMWDPLSQFASLQRQVTQLKNSLPSSLLYNSDNLAAHVTERLANQFIFLHLTIAQNNLFLHRFAIPTAPNTRRAYPPNTPKSFLATSAATAVDAAAQISKLLGDSTGHTLTVPFAGYCAYASATVHIWGIFSKNTSLENSSRDNLRSCYKYLNRMKRYWAMFHYMAESVKDTYRAFADASARLTRKQVRTQGPPDPFDDLDPSAKVADGLTSEPEQDELQGKSDGSKVRVFQYGDWFDKYPHGVSEKEWEQNHHPHRDDSLKGSEAIMSQQSELQSVEEFLASLSPPSKADDPTYKRRVARKRGKSTFDDKTAKIKEYDIDSGRRQSHGPTQQSTSSNELPQHRPSQGLTSNSMYPLSEMTFPLDLANSNSEIDVPMSGVSAGLQSGHGNSAFDDASPTAMLSSGRDQPYTYSSISGPTSNPQHQSRSSLSHSQPQQETSPFDYASPALSSSTMGGANRPPNPNSMNFNFNYTSAVPQLDRQMVFGGYASIDPHTTASTASLNNINNVDFWSNPWDTQLDMDGLTGFNDPSFGLNQGTSVLSGNNDSDSRRSSAVPTQVQSQSQSQSQAQFTNLNSGPFPNQNQIHRPTTMTTNSTAFFMPFNIEPPSSVHFGAGGSNMHSFDEFSGLDSMMDMGGFSFSPDPGVRGEGGG